MTTESRPPWAGPKKKTVCIRVTVQEMAELKEAAEERGGIGVGRYLMNLHHRKVGNLKEWQDRG